MASNMRGGTRPRGIHVAMGSLLLPPRFSSSFYFFLIISCTTVLTCSASNMADALTSAAVSASTSTAAAALVNESDGLSLLAFKAGIADDPTGALNSWNESLPLCRWRGVTCGRRGGSPAAGRRGGSPAARVSALNLSFLGLSGHISPSVAKLSYLERILLGGNRLSGVIPPELGRLSRLRSLNLSSNSLTGEIPSNLSRCSELRSLNLEQNQLVGGIPPALGSLSKLVGLNLAGNQLSGTIPPTLGNLSSSSFVALYLATNKLTGAIPHELGRLAGLRYFEVHVNKLSGSLPISLYNLSLVRSFIVAINQISGTIPADVGSSLPSLRSFVVSGNRLTGTIPSSFPNVSSLQQLQFADNMFTGTIPSNLGSLRSLQTFAVGINQLEAHDAAGWSFFASLANCTRLRYLDFGENTGLQGVLPSTIANLSAALQVLTMPRCNISGNIPQGLANLASLTTLLMGGNQFNGVIPGALGKLQGLIVLELSANGFSGEIPSALGNLTGLSRLYLGSNELQGRVPSSFGNFQHLQWLDISRNNLSGSVPDEIFRLSSLSLYLDLSHNSFTGPLPATVGHLRNLGELELSGNKFSGEIPSALGDCLGLEYLAMADNSFWGNIPPSLGNLRGIQELDLSLNNLSGAIPSFLGDLRLLWRLNFSFNNFEGEVPGKGVFRNASALSLSGNTHLCGGIPRLRLPPCTGKRQGSRKRKLTTFIAIAAPCLFLSLCLTALLIYMMRKSKAPRAAVEVSSSADKHAKISYGELVKATDGFASTNLLGAGGFGSVYKGILDDGQKVIAVKVFNLQLHGASKSFVAECEALRNARHRNLVKIVTSCSSVDSSGNDFKALVLEFMTNGSLEEWLHPKSDVSSSELRILGFAQRLSIAIDVASALDYLHNDCHPVIVHCDLKPSNVLLDNDMTAHVGDFGIATLLHEATRVDSGSTTSIYGLRGSVGYSAPEYGLGGPVSTRGDAYSFGILLLEMFTGKRPTDTMFQDGLSLRSFVETAVPERILDVVIDPWLLSLLDEEEVVPHGWVRKGARGLSPAGRRVECLVSVMEIGLLCTVEPPRERMGMGDVVPRLHAIRDVYLGIATTV